jgi:hypothetical protein
MQGKGIFHKRMIPQKYFFQRNFSFADMPKAKKSISGDEKKSSQKNNLKDMIRQSVQPPPKAITPPEKPSKKKNKKSG